MTSIKLEEYSESKPSVVTVGSFDGIHLGHMKLIEKTISISKEEGLKSIILTFNPHPKVILNKKSNFSFLSTYDEKNTIFKSLDFDFLVVKKFDDAFSKLTPEEFVRDILVEKLNVKHVVIGYDHHFGRNRDASYKTLNELSKVYNFKVTQIDAYIKDGISVSSTKIRNYISKGNFELANKLLGYEFNITGTVVKGKSRGKTLGFPTANIVVNSSKILPGNGVYLINSKVFNKSIHGMMNVGQNPTFKDKEHSIEIHFFDFEKNIYGIRISVNILKKIREEIKFDSSSELSKQLQEDKKKCFQIIKSLKKTS